ncbi:MAG: myo-inositol-1(or 4)-monophosphatase [Parcubacteria group bacterium Gr01-1014_70]|nr:MAG: myo-inositol-1(or 4)-monophosphatase [Parcubacteria group bacterium Gr01-1014_70]
MISNVFELGCALFPFTEKITDRIMRTSHTKLKYKDKGEGQLQTELDRSFDALLYQFVETHDPGYEIISEESAPEVGTIKNAWIFDPLDGTQNTAMGTPMFGIALMRVDKGHVTMGAIFLPARRLMGASGLYVAGTGQGAWEYSSTYGDDDRKLMCSTQTDLAKSTMLIEGPSKSALMHPAVQKLIDKSQRSRVDLSATWSTILVASGGLQTKGADFLVTVKNKLWDNLPMCLFIEEAGGKVTDLEGNPWSLENYANLLCTNSLLHMQALQTIENM